MFHDLLLRKKIGAADHTHIAGFMFFIPLSKWRGQWTSALSKLLLCVGWNWPPANWGQTAQERPLEGTAGEQGAQGAGKSII